MLVVMIENPPDSFVNPENEVMEIILVFTILLIKLLLNFVLKSIITHEVVQCVCDLLDVQIDVAFKVFVPDRMHDFVSVFFLFGNDHNQGV